MRVTPFFRRQWSIFWATTYSIDVRAFEDFWFPRLSEPPINATILVDRGRLAAFWDHFGSEPPLGLHRVNRDYLLRGVSMGDGSFHPKTYMFADHRRGALLVGSGNLGLGGLEEGREVFTVFDSNLDEDLPTFRRWREWMSGLVRELNDPSITARWAALLQKASWLNSAPNGDSPFVHNLAEPLVGQFASFRPADVEELHFTAPFYDRDLAAVKQLLSLIRPKMVHVYFGEDVSVDGERLVKLLMESRLEANYWRYEDHFVHAKLVGMLGPDTGVLLSGSPNLSRPALLTRATERGGNTETATIVPGLSRNDLLSVFRPSGQTIQSIDEEAVNALKLRDADDAESSWQIALLDAKRRQDGKVAVRFMEDEPPRSLWLSHANGRLRISGSVTDDAILEQSIPLVVWLSSEEEAKLSNSVALEDEISLQRALREKSSVSEDRPSGMSPGDFDTPLGAMLDRLNRECIFDIAETPAARAATAASEAEPDDPSFWDNFTRDLLQQDSRVYNYQRRFGFDPESMDGVLALLRGMLAQASEHQTIRAVGTAEQGPGGTRESRLTGPNVELRAFNVLHRWCDALDNEQLRWVDDFAPTINFVHLATALLECLEKGLLNAERVTSLCETILASCFGDEKRRGFLAGYSEAEMATAWGLLNVDVRAAIAAFIFWSLQKDAWRRTTVLRLQPAIGGAEKFDLVQCTDEIAAKLDPLFHQHVTAGFMQERIQWAATYMDDEEWCRRTASDLGLDELSFSKEAYGPNRHGLEVKGDSARLENSALVPLVKRVLTYKKVDGVVLVLGSSRLAFELYKPVNARVDGGILRSQRLLSEEVIDDLESAGAGWDTLLLPVQNRAG